MRCLKCLKNNVDKLHYCTGCDSPLTEDVTAVNIPEPFLSVIEKQQKEIAKWKEKEFQACSKHHEFIDDIERLEKEIESWKNCLREHKIILSDKYAESTKLHEENEDLKQYKKVLMENSVVRSDYIKKLEKELVEAYKSRKHGHMFWAGELEWINNRIKELEGE